MRILFDQGVPVPLRRLLPGQDVVTVYERGWSRLENGKLLAAAEADGFEVFLTTDKNLKHQQDLSGRSMAILVLETTSWPRIRAASATIVAALGSAIPGSYAEVSID
ncbi:MULTISPECIES: hypothetical protein [Thiorhodovibrio]|uniref:hypothetical protein n=1 Tax=Thiorhodovibrio TaxID=61593 RepID=UPI0019128804|nr:MULTISPECIES: hypothetical protein [Thiorhodovibrio]MBK5970380.1 hypothetical protein [Thiorhodovibrio winogradskyi]